MLRIIAHLDLDCFYCQVEHKRLDIPREEPLAVQQWDSVIAVNYAARAAPYSIKRGMRAEECKKRCPSIHLIHVEYIGEDKQTKVSLKRYRLASMEIMSILQRLCPLCERASIDEAYLDITDMCKTSIPGLSLLPEHFMTIDGSALNPSTPYEDMLMNAASLILHVRTTIQTELGFTVSAGIATNKMIAKQASASRKPNKQTLIPLSSMDVMMKQLSLRDVRGLGGKLGEALARFTKATMAYELQVHSEKQLCAHFGEKTGRWIYRMCRGQDEESVKPNLKPKSLLSIKSFSAVTCKSDLESWMTLMCEEVQERVADDYQLNHRLPQSVIVHHALELFSGGSTRDNRETASRTGPLRRTHSAASRNTICPSAQDLLLSAHGLLSKLPKVFPCVSVGIGVTGFVDVPSCSTHKSISSFFRAPTTPETTRAVNATEETELQIEPTASSPVPVQQEASPYSYYSIETTVPDHDDTTDITDISCSAQSLCHNGECDGSDVCPDTSEGRIDDPICRRSLQRQDGSNTTTKDQYSIPVDIDSSSSMKEGKECVEPSPEAYLRINDTVARKEKTASGNYIICEKCHSEIQNETMAIMEHQDYHFSLEVQKELRREEQQARTAAHTATHVGVKRTPPPPSGKNKRVDTDKSKKSKIDRFFSKKPNV